MFLPNELSINNIILSGLPVSLFHTTYPRPDLIEDPTVFFVWIILLARIIQLTESLATFIVCPDKYSVYCVYSILQQPFTRVACAASESSWFCNFQ